jgi:transcriptional regulator with XRE-family HTH domain
VTTRRFAVAAAVLEDLGACVRAARSRHGLSQEDVADATGLHGSQVSHVERFPDYGLGRRGTVALLLWLDRATGDVVDDDARPPGR